MLHKVEHFFAALKQQIAKRHQTLAQARAASAARRSPKVAAPIVPDKVEPWQLTEEEIAALTLPPIGGCAFFGDLAAPRPRQVVEVGFMKCGHILRVRAETQEEMDSALAGLAERDLGFDYGDAAVCSQAAAMKFNDLKGMK